MSGVDANMPNAGNRSNADEYLKRASAACAAGDAVLGMHLYLAAFEEAAATSDVPEESAVDGLKQAWALACRLKERSMAEYIFEKMQPHLTSDEALAAGEALRGLMMDKLEEFGVSRDELRDIANAISREFEGVPLGDGAQVEVKSVMLPPAAVKRVQSCATGCCSGSDKAAAAEAAPDAPAKAPAPADVKLGGGSARLTYADIAGYGETVKVMRDYGFGMQDDPEFAELIELLNRRHGLDRAPAADSLLFRSPAREDAERFMDATAGELGLPCLRMRIEENLQGLPVLCVMALADDAPPMNAARNEFTGRAALLLENLDMWTSPYQETSDDFEGFVYAQLSRGAREAVKLIRAAVENPDVYVLASASIDGEIDPFYYDLLEPLSIIDIDLPTPEERIDIWMDIQRAHPSIRGVNVADLVRYSSNMPRFDMYMAVREAIEEAYKESLVTRRYVPVGRENLFDKLAAYQPLDSREYRELENAVVRDFARGLDELPSLLDGREG